MKTTNQKKKNNSSKNESKYPGARKGFIIVGAGERNNGWKWKLEWLGQGERKGLNLELNKNKVTQMSLT